MNARAKTLLSFVPLPLLVALWVRSLYASDTVGFLPSRAFTVSRMGSLRSDAGMLTVCFATISWDREHMKDSDVDELRKLFRPMSYFTGEPGAFQWDTGGFQFRWIDEPNAFIRRVDGPIATVPTAIPVLVAAIWPSRRILRATRTRRRLRQNRCPACGYSLVANTTGTCPECGASRPPISSPTTPPV